MISSDKPLIFQRYHQEMLVNFNLTSKYFLPEKDF